MSEGYLQTKMDGKETYVQAISLDKLREVDAVIFDCDGVLIDVRESCNRAISETVTYMIRELTGFSLPKNLISKEIIYFFKESGGFNNDWDLAYAILMFIFSRLPERSQEALKRAINTNERKSDLFRYFLSVKDSVRKELSLPDALSVVVVELEEALTQFAKMLDATGLVSAERRLIPSNASRAFLEYYGSLKRFLSYPGEVGESLVTTVFEEIFCGPQLFREVHERAPKFYQGPGLIENEQIILLPETVDRLTSILGKPNLGISSGRPFKLAKHTLSGLLNKFNPKALVFFDDIEAAERENTGKMGPAVNLRKPNPYSLFTSSKVLEPFRFTLYVGDSMEDVVMAKEANRLNPRFLFAGVYEYSDCKEEVLRSFLEAGSEIVLPSVNELPVILKVLREGGTI